MTNAQYLRAIFGWVAVYGASLVASFWLVGRAPVGAWLVLATLVPVPALFGMLHAIMQRYRAMDELERRMLGEAIVFGFGTTAIVTFTYGFLENTAHAPVLSYFWVWPIMAASWGLGAAVTGRRYR